jgi:hypothetical protein
MTRLKEYYWAIIPVLGWLIVRFGFGFNGLYGQDAYAYLLYAREWKSFFLGGETPGSFFWPPNYSIVSALLALFVKTEFYSLQLISLLSMIVIGWLLDRWIRKAYSVDIELRIVYVSLAFLLSPYMFRLGMQSMSDMFAMMLVLASFYHLWRFIEAGEFRSLLFWSFFSGLAITTRYPTVIVLFPSIVFVVFRLLANKQLGRFAMGLMVGLTPILLAIWWMLGSGGIHNDIQNLLQNDWSITNFVRTEFHRGDTNSNFILPNLLFNLSAFVHPGTLFFGVFLLPFAFKGLKTDLFRLLVLSTILIYGLFLSGIPFQNSRVMTFTYPLIVMFLVPAFLRFSEWLKSKNLPLKTVFFLAVVFQTGLCARAMQPSILYNQFERELAAWIASEFPKTTVYTSSYSQLFDVYETGNSVVQIYDQPISFFEDGAIFIFNESLADFKLQGTMPLKNWEAANNLMKVEKQKCWTNGWCVYSLSSK